MTTIRTDNLLRQIRKLAIGQAASQQTDQHLLQQFIAERDETAFAALVQRHGGMVLGICRNVLRHQQDAEDVFQAAFLVLARKAPTIRKQQSLSSWLHGVAYRLALKARSQAIRRRDREKSASLTPATSVQDDLTVSEYRAILHEELQRLPEKYRTPLLLCYWEGKTRDEAAQQIGLSSGAFKKLLERARNLLGSRLSARGLVPAAFFAVLLSTDAVKAAVSSSLLQSTVSAAVAFAAGKSVTAGTPAAVLLAEGVLRAMQITKWAMTISALLFLASAGTVLGLVFQGSSTDAPAKKGAAAGTAQAKQPKTAKTDQERIVGTWRFVSGRMNGQEMPAEMVALGRFTFRKDGTLSLTVAGEETRSGKYQLKGAGKIDVQLKDNETALGIYRFDGNDRLSLCIRERQADKSRPTEFTGEQGKGQSLTVLQRAKPGEEKVSAKEAAQFKEPVNQLREAAARTQSANNLRQIGLSFHNHHDAYGFLPQHAIYSIDGKTPLLSWRVAILPFIEEVALYQEFKLDEPWDSPHNKKLIAKMPKLYAPLKEGKKREEGLTYYQVITGPGTLFDGAKKVKLQGITDGTANTILAVEAKNPVIWSKPDDVTLPKDKDKLPALGGLFKSGMNILLCDGSTRFVSNDPDPAIFRALVTPQGGEAVSADKLKEVK